MIRKQHGTFVWNVLLFAGFGNIFQNKIRLNLPTLHYLIDSNPLKGKSPQFWLIFIENLTAGICLLSNPIVNYGKRGPQYLWSRIWMLTFQPLKFR